MKNTNKLRTTTEEKEKKQEKTEKEIAEVAKLGVSFPTQLFSPFFLSFP
jgi:hypothetical protein